MDLDNCEICHLPLSKVQREWNHKRIETSACGRKKCQLAWKVKYGELCCTKAKNIPCVCFRSYTCPEHGERHIGTHD